jgi:aspartyl-tRNA(Asn)/glutamyl-tRNA(Gln) amidotransferase subunit B
VGEEFQLQVQAKPGSFMKIGLEIHIALPTKSKLFCSCSTSGELPNTEICPICMGFPGSKPMLNEEAVRVSKGIANALHCTVRGKISFVRKVYFYPDLPKSYQITQTDASIGVGGYLDADGKRVNIRRVQIEEDPAKLVREGALTLIDFNRAGMPLVEVVTEPDINSYEELWSFLRNLRSVLYYLGIDIEKEVKADLNVSVSGGRRVEVKNITGIKNLITASKYEIDRQTNLVKQGKEVIGETRGYNEKKRITESMREKETEEEYGYIFEPDLTVFKVDELDYVKPTYAKEVALQLASKYNANYKTIEELIMFDSRALDLINKFKDKHTMKSVIHAIESAEKYGKESMPDENFEKLIEIIEKDVVVTKEILEGVGRGEKISVNYAKLEDDELDKIIKEFIEKNKDVLKDYGKNKKALNYIIGEIAKKYSMHPKDVARRVEALIKKL